VRFLLGLSFNIFEKRRLIPMKRVLVAGMMLLSASCGLACEDEQARIEAVAKVKLFTDAQLQQTLEKLLGGSHFRDDPLYEPCLGEIVRRGGKTWEAFLAAKLETLNKKQFKLSKDDDYPEPGSYHNLELLTALRRVQKKSDPLAVALSAKGPLEASLLSLPRLDVAMKNVDCDKAAVGFREGGDYRSGRQARWRIVVRDNKGVELPEKKLSGVIIEGGIYRDENLKHGKTWETTLDVRSFVKIDLPGTYSLQVLYHNTKELADASDISGLIVARSKPIALIVRPLVIAVTAEERKEIARWISALDGSKPLKVVAGTYGKWAHEFVPPTTAEGRILGAGLKAVPVLIEALANRSLSDNKRAWILSLLFSATGENDPRDFSGAVGAYRYREAGWQIWGGPPGGPQSGGIGCSDEGSSSGGEISREAQDKLIETWGDWLRTVEVRQRRCSDRQKPAVAKEKRTR
jgi:hypothetical protein